VVAALAAVCALALDVAVVAAAVLALHLVLRQHFRVVLDTVAGLWKLRYGIRQRALQRIWVIASRQIDLPWTDSASGQLSRWRFRVRMLRYEGVSESKELDLVDERKGERMGFVCG